MGFHGFFSIVLALIAFTFLCFSLLSTEANDGGFTIDLIHRDSPESPMYNPSHSPYELMKKACQRSSKRQGFFASTGMIPEDGEYLMEISFGKPPFKTYAIADSGSDLAWIQCKPCTKCFPDEIPIFNPIKSSSFKFIPCNSRTCKAFYGHYCEETEHKKTNPTCTYYMNYGDGSSSLGDLATETITFGSKARRVSFPKFVFGCGHQNGGQFSQNTSGIVGLGFGKQSIISQLDKYIRGKFSYCLSPFTEESKSGKLNFGPKSVVSGDGVVATPLILDDYYYLILEGMSVGNKRLNYNYTSPPHRPLRGNIIIDSGTTASYLPPELYKELESTLRSELVKKSHMTSEDPLRFFTLCFQSLDDADIPTLTFHFKGADLKLNPSTTFVPTSETVRCLGFSGLSSIPIFGNIAQSNLWVGYDLHKKLLSFKPTDCTKH